MNKIVGLTLLIFSTLFSCNRINNTKKNFHVQVKEKFTNYDSIPVKGFYFSIYPKSDSIEMVEYYIGPYKKNAPRIVEYYELIAGNGKEGHIFYKLESKGAIYRKGFAHIFTTNSEYLVPFAFNW